MENKQDEDIEVDDDYDDDCECLPDPKHIVFKSIALAIEQLLEKRLPAIAESYNVEFFREFETDKLFMELGVKLKN